MCRVARGVPISGDWNRVGMAGGLMANHLAKCAQAAMRLSRPAVAKGTAEPFPFPDCPVWLAPHLVMPSILEPNAVSRDRSGSGLGMWWQCARHA